MIKRGNFRSWEKKELIVLLNLLLFFKPFLISSGVKEEQIIRISKKSSEKVCSMLNTERGIELENAFLIYQGGLLSVCEKAFSERYKLDEGFRKSLPSTLKNICAGVNSFLEEINSSVEDMKKYKFLIICFTPLLLEAGYNNTWGCTR